MPSVVQPSGNPPEAWHPLCIPGCAGCGCGVRGVGVGCGYWAWMSFADEIGDVAKKLRDASHTFSTE
eukprot:5130902-Prorocentrum_lima.AAC.1